MKTIILIPLLLIVSQCLAQQQTHEIKFNINNNKAHWLNGDTNNVTLPLRLIFSGDFKDKTVAIKDKAGQTLAAKVKKFGDANLSEDGETGSYFIEIDKDKNINPGVEKINEPLIKLHVSGQVFTLNFKPTIEDADLIDKAKATTALEYQPGYIYFDALTLAEKLKAGTHFELTNKILTAYGINATNYVENPYLAPVLQPFFAKGINQGIGASSFLKNIGNTDVTQFAAGLARFLAERTKEELNEAFFNKMKAELNAYPELGKLFPKTTTFLNAIETYSYASVLQILKEAFETDMANLAENLYQLKDLSSADCSAQLKAAKLEECKKRLDRLANFFKSHRGAWTKLGMFTVKEALQASNPAKLLETVSESSALLDLTKTAQDSSKFEDLNIIASIKLAHLISYSLINKNEEDVWASQTEFAALLREKDAFRIYLGLLYTYVKNQSIQVTFYKEKGVKVELVNLLLQVGNSYDSYQSKITDLIKNTQTAFSSANNAVKKIKSATNGSAEVNPQPLYDYYKTFISSLKIISRNALIKSFTNFNLDTNLSLALLYLDPAVDIAYHISTKKYSAALYDAITLLNNANSQVLDRPVMKSMIKYGTLISTVASAQSSDEVKKALEASVLPVGSASIKRKSDWSISINAYVGGYWGKVRTHRFEKFTNPTTSLPDSTKVNVSYQSFGLYAPVGFSLSKGLKGWGGFSLTAQVIDLGALVNFYLVNGDETALPSEFKVRLSNIFAPGAQLAYNIPGLPLSVTAGFQYVPSLYQIDQVKTGSQLVGASAWRKHVSLVVDLPLYNIKVWDFRK